MSPNNQPDFPPEVIKKATQALCDRRCTHISSPCEGNEGLARAVLAAVAEWTDNERYHVWHAQSHQRGMAEGARAVIAAILGEAPRVNSELRHDGSEDPQMAAYIEGHRDAWVAACDALARIEKEN